MTLYFNRVHNYSQDCSLPYGPMKQDTTFLITDIKNTKMTKYEGIIKIEIT